MKIPSRIARSMLGVCAAVLVGTGLVYGQDGPDKEAVERVKSMGRRFLPTPKDLAATGQWKLPWELPKAFPIRISNSVNRFSGATEDAYWQSIAGNLELAGKVPADVGKKINEIVTLFTTKGKKEGLGEREAVVALRMMFQAAFRGTPTLAQSWDEQWDQVNRLMQAAVKAKETKKVPKGDLVALQLLMEPFQGQKTEEIRERLIKDITLIQKETELVFFRCNNWDALIKELKSPSTGGDDWDAKGIQITMVTIRVRLYDPARLAEIRDLKKDDLVKLQTRLDNLLKSFVKSQIQLSQLEVNELEDRAAKDENLKERVKKKKEELTRIRAELPKARMAAAPLDFGENGYTLQLYMPLNASQGAPLSDVAGWIRNGPAVAIIDFAGNAPPDQMAKEMTTFLRIMHEKTREFRGD